MSATEGEGICAVTYAEATEIGIDNLEHGFFVNTANDPTRNRIHAAPVRTTLEHMVPPAVEADRLITTLVAASCGGTDLPGLAATVRARLPRWWSALAAGGASDVAICATLSLLAQSSRPLE